MKLDKLIEKLQINNTPSQSKYMKFSGDEKVKNGKNINNIFLNKTVYKTNNSNCNELKIIGITGSKGKSTTAYLIHSYLKYIGYRSVLYSSIGIDSPTSYNSPNVEVENPLRDQKMLLDAVIQAKTYEADFLILEVNERAIANGYIDEVPFDVKLITNIIPNHSKFFYPANEYVNIKKSFLINQSDEEPTCIFGIDDIKVFNLLNSLNIKNKKIFGSRYVANVRGIKESSIDYLLFSDREDWHSLDGMSMSIKYNGNTYNIKTNLIMPYNALNILSAISVLDVLNVLDITALKEMLSIFRIPGRDEIIEVNDRYIILSPHLIPQIEILRNYKNLNKIKCLKVVSGTVGEGYKTWKKEFSNEIYKSEKESAIEFAYGYLKKYADLVYITTNDLGASNSNSLLSSQAGYLDNDTRYEIIQDRKEAIRRSITNSEPGDLIYISGRGNRRIFCESRDTVQLFKDIDIVNKVLVDLKWKE